MFAHRQYATILQTSCVGRDFTCHVLRVFTERTSVDDRIFGIDVHVGHRSEIDLYAHFTTFARHFPSVGIEQTVILDAAQYYVAWESGRIFQAHGQTPFSVQGYHKWYVCPLLGLVGQYYLILYFTFGEQQAANIVFFDDFSQ